MFIFYLNQIFSNIMCMSLILLKILKHFDNNYL